MPGKQSKMQFATKTIEHTLRHCSNSDIRDILTISVVAAKQAGAILLDRYGKPHDIQHKGSIDIVTEADLASEELILDVLHHNFPGTKILSEESFSSYGNIPDEPVWIIDPLDGTTNYKMKNPFFNVSIALAKNNK